MNLEGVTSVHIDAETPVDLNPGVRLRTLYASAALPMTKIQYVEIAPGGRFLDLDVHQFGPEDVFVLNGIFNDGMRDYSAGSLIHNPTGSSHIPQSVAGCKLLVLLPEG